MEKIDTNVKGTTTKEVRPLVRGRSLPPSSQGGR
jgi:hypothetical protein